MLDSIAPYLDATALSWLLGLPLLAALALLFTARWPASTVRGFALGVMLLELLLSLHLLRADYASSGYRFLASYPLIPGFGIAYTVGVDGISLWLVLLTTFVTPIALLASCASVHTKVREFAACFLVLEAALIGSFVVLDLFLFYVFWELALVPAYLIIGIWGGQRRIHASLNFFLYTLVGSLLMFVAIVYVASAYRDVAGVYSFDIRKLTALVLEADTQLWLFLAFALAFAIKIPLVPFHSWVPHAYVQAPTSGTIVLTAVLLKMGTYGFIRYALPLFPLAAHQCAPSLSVLAVVGIIYGAYCAWVQSDLKKLVAYSSISHLGFVMLGIFSLTKQGVGGAVLQMVNHGISTGALFLLVGLLDERRQTRSLSQLGGIAKVMPVYAVALMLVTLSSIGVPGTNGFVGEFMILTGTFLSRTLPTPFVFTLFAALGVILSAVYMLRAVTKVLYGPVPSEAGPAPADLGRRELTALAPLLVMVVALGLAPRLLLGNTHPAVGTFLRAYDQKLAANAANGRIRLLKLDASYALLREER